jgi:hypothetical protein
VWLFIHDRSLTPDANAADYIAPINQVTGAPLACSIKCSTSSFKSHRSGWAGRRALIHSISAPDHQCAALSSKQSVGEKCCEKCCDFAIVWVRAPHASSHAHAPRSRRSSRRPHRPTPHPRIHARPWLVAKASTQVASQARPAIACRRRTTSSHAVGCCAASLVANSPASIRQLTRRAELDLLVHSPHVSCPWGHCLF